MVCEIVFAPNSPIFRKSCWEEEAEEEKKVIVKHYAFQTSPQVTDLLTGMTRSFFL